MLFRLKNILFLLIFIGINTFINAQSESDTTQLAISDTSAVDTTKKTPREWSKPEKAAIMSGILPGLGQFSNKKYWKIPIILIGEGVLISAAIYQHSQYRIARNELNDFLIDSIPLEPKIIGGFEVISEHNFRTARDKHRSKRDNYIVYASLLYLLNIVDAAVDAHLAEFDLSDDLSLKIKPTLYPINNTFATGVSLNFRLK